MTRREDLESRIAPTLERLGFEVVRVAVIGGSHKTLQVMADRCDGRPISVDDCATVSEVLSALFDVEEPLAGAYDLEVSSPGIDRPLTRAKDFAAYAGHDVKIETRTPVDGRRRFKGVLKGLEATDVAVIEVEGLRHDLALANILSAKLVLTDKLIAASQAAMTTMEQ